MASQAVALLQSDYQSLSKEAGRRHSDVREVSFSSLGMGLASVQG